MKPNALQPQHTAEAPALSRAAACAALHPLASQPPTARLVLALLLSSTLALSTLAAGVAAPQPAFAETTEIDAEPDTFQQEIERTAQAFDEASARVAELEQLIADNQAEIEQLEADLPEQQERGAEALRALYKLQHDMPGLIELILNAKSLDDFLTAFEYIDHIQQRNVSELSRLRTMKDSLAASQTELENAQASAAAEQSNAKEALSAAQQARQEAQRKAQEEAARQAEQEAARLAEEAAKAAEEEKRLQEQREAEAAAKDAEEAAPEEAESSASESTEAIVPSPPNDVDWASDKTAFVAEWSGRIDAYLSGSPLAGQGATFAEAAWTYGVDPRWSPAIANTESTKGAYCAYAHNAWGWGSVSWGSWEEAINAHVRGLANGYGYTISVGSAKKYCPPNWEHWYNVTLAQMNMM